MKLQIVCAWLALVTIAAAQEGAPATGSMMILRKGWDSRSTAGLAAEDELKKLLAPIGEPKVDLGADPSIEFEIKVADDAELAKNPAVSGTRVRYLTAVNEVKSALNLRSSAASKVLVTCAGFPQNSLYYYSFEGHFEDDFDKLSLVVDAADHLVAFQVAKDLPEAADDLGVTDWHVSNFINFRTKGAPSMSIGHRVLVGTGGNYLAVADWHGKADSSAPDFIARLETVVRDKNNLRRPIREVSRLYLPQPLVNTMLHCLGAQKPAAAAAVPVLGTPLSISVKGQVQKAGDVPYVPDLTLSKAIELAGGLKEGTEGKHIIVTRGAQKIPIDYRVIKANPQFDLKLSPLDSVSVED